MNSPGGWAIEPLGGRHVREHFDCGEPELDLFIRKHARQNEDRGISRTYVVVRGSDPRVLGYYTLRMGAVESEDLPAEEVRRLPRYPIPVIHLARLGVDRSVQGQGVGQALVASALRKAVLASEIVGAFAVEVSAKNEEAQRFYEKYGFKAFLDNALHLYLPIATIQRIRGQ